MSDPIVLAVLGILSTSLIGIGTFFRQTCMGLIKRVDKLETKHEECHAERLKDAEARGELKAEVAALRQQLTPKRKRTPIPNPVVLPEKQGNQTINVTVTPQATPHEVRADVKLDSSHSIETPA